MNSKLTTEAEGKILQSLVLAIFDSTTIDAPAAAADKLIKELLDKAQPVAAAIASIVRSSINYVWVDGRNIDYLRIVTIVSADLSGAPLGAAGCITLGPVVAAIGALAGAVAGSSGVALASRHQ